ncbi:ABC-type sugar transport system ATPase subunit [Agrobacterium sp. SORGH_AS440]|nr:ABC-type sugar transport system ATPase subunit [Agrobacterium sp. SORGH_AS_0440]
MLIFLSPEEVVNSMVGRVLDKLYPPKLSDDEKSDDVILSVRGLNEGKRVFDVGFDLRRGEILGLAGLIGAGRSEIARAVCRLEGKPTGEVMLRGQRLGLKDYRDSIREGIVYLSEDRKGDGLFLNMSIAANVSALDIGRISNGMGFIERRKEMKRADELGRRLKLRANSVGDSVSTLSGGNQQKVALAKMLSVEPKVIFLDEPTRGVDVGAKAEIHRQIRELAREGVGVVVISSELPELIGVSDRVLVVREGRITGEVEGDDMTEEKIMQLASITIMQNAAEA